MSIPISQLSEDNVASSRDLIVITDETTGNSKNLAVEKLMDFIQAAATSIVTTSNINTVTETATKDWLAVLNTSVLPWVIGTGEVAFVQRYDQTSAYVGTYILIKSAVETLRIGQGEVQVTLSDFIIVRDTGDVGEVNTMSSFGAGVALLKSKTGVDFIMQSLKAGALGTISVSVEADGIHIDTTAGLGEVNTASSVGAGASVFSAKNVADLELRSLTGVYCDVGVNADVVEIQPWGKITRAASFIVSAADSQRTIQIDNGATPVVITVPDTLSADFEMAVVQLGTGEVSFITSGTATILGTLSKIKGQYQSAWIETKEDDPTKIILLGDIKL